MTDEESLIVKKIRAWYRVIRQEKNNFVAEYYERLEKGGLPEPDCFENLQNLAKWIEMLCNDGQESRRELLESTCDMYEEPWNPKEGTLIAVYDDRYQEWQARVLVRKSIKGDGWWCVDGGYTLEAHRKGLVKATKWSKAESLTKHFKLYSL